MRVGLVGDVHGRVRLVLVALATWQRSVGYRFDLIIQVGDMGAFPDLDTVDPATDPYLAAEPSQADFSRMLRADGELLEPLRRIRQELLRPIHFIRGNHEDFNWLDHLPIDAATRTARADPYDLFHYVPDGTVLTVDGCTIAFLGGACDDPSVSGAIDPSAHQALMELGPGKIDLLITHDAPYGISVGYHGQIQGSRLVTELMGTLQPTHHVAGHLGHIGPRVYGGTTFLCLGDLTESILWHPEARGLQAGCLAVLDTATSDLRPVTDPWLATFERSIDFAAWFQTFIDG